ncbi:Myotubularin-related protein 9-like [Vulpes lagopus]
MERAPHGQHRFVTSLAQLILNPLSWTMAGFQELVEREWIQLGRQFPLLLEFGEGLLLALFEHAYASPFGTFLCNSRKERCPVQYLTGKNIGRKKGQVITAPGDGYHPIHQGPQSRIPEGII